MSKLYIKKRYGQAPNSLLNCPEISLKAKGLFTFLQSKPDGWSFSVKKISFQTKDGQESVNTAIKELEELGFLSREPMKDKKGQWSGYKYTLRENIEKEEKKEKRETPLRENPVTENLST